MLDKSMALSGALCAEGCYATLPNTVKVPLHQQSTVKDDTGGDISVHGAQPVRQQLLYADEQSGVSGCDPNYRAHVCGIVVGVNKQTTKKG